MKLKGDEITVLNYLIEKSVELPEIGWMSKSKFFIKF